MSYASPSLTGKEVIIVYPDKGHLFWMYSSFLKNGSDLIFLQVIIKSV